MWEIYPPAKAVNFYVIRMISCVSKLISSFTLLVLTVSFFTIIIRDKKIN